MPLAGSKTSPRLAPLPANSLPETQWGTNFIVYLALVKKNTFIEGLLKGENMTEVSKAITQMIAQHPPKQAAVLQKLRELILQLVPGASERIS